jgi:hypothetical protein
MWTTCARGSRRLRTRGSCAASGMPGTELTVTLEGGRIVLNPVRVKSQRLSAWPDFGRGVPALSDEEAFAPVDLQDAP